LLLHPSIEVRRSVTRLVPVVDQRRCAGSGVCASVCRFGAIVRLPTQTLVHPELCTSCGVCVAACPHGAIDEAPRPVGSLEIGWAESIRFVQGTLDPGQARSIPVIEDALNEIPVNEDLVVIDAPSGTSSPVIAALRHADLVIVVSDATLFGRVDFGIMLDLVRRLGVGFGVVINRSDIGDRRLHHLCLAEEIPIFGTIPYSRSLARAYAQGSLDAISPLLHEVIESTLDHALSLPVGERP
jgi:MinD superfamily P-loop ATPase